MSPKNPKYPQHLPRYIFNIRMQLYLSLVKKKKQQTKENEKLDNLILKNQIIYFTEVTF